MMNNYKNLILTSLLGFLTCIFLGLTFYGSTIFNYSDSRFQIIAIGLFGAVFYSFLKYRNLREQILIIIVLLIFNFLTYSNSISFTVLIRDIIFVLSIISAIILYKFFIDKYLNVPLFVRGLSLSLALGVIHILATLFLILIFNPSAVKINAALFLNAQYAALIGLGLGIGFDIFEKFKYKLVSENNAKVV